MFLVVEFTDDHSLAVIPSIWRDGNQCALWPPYKSCRADNAAKQKERPGDHWQSYPIRVLYEGDTYEKARDKLKLAEDQSDVNTPNEVEECHSPVKRKRRLPEKLQSSSEEEGPSPAQKSTPRPAVSPQTELPSPPRRLPFTSKNITDPAHCQQNNQVRDSRFFTMLEKISIELGEQRRLLNLIIRKLPNDDQLTSQALPDNIKFPLKTVEELNSLEEKLQDSAVYKSVLNHLSCFGGNAVKDTIWRLLRETLSSDLAQKYNFLGKKGKLPFGNLKLTSLYFKCLQKNPSTRGATLKEMEKPLKDWLRGAKDRACGKRKIPLVQSVATMGNDADSD